MTLAELNRHYELRERLDQAREIVASLRQKALPAAAALTGMPHTPGVSDKVGDLAAEIADAEAVITYLEAEITASEGPVLAYIQSIPDMQTRLVFRLRFIRGLTWSEVAGTIGGGNTETGVKAVCYRWLSAEENL